MESTSSFFCCALLLDWEVDPVIEFCMTGIRAMHIILIEYDIWILWFPSYGWVDIGLIVATKKTHIWHELQRYGYGCTHSFDSMSLRWLCCPPHRKRLAADIYPNASWILAQAFRNWHYRLGHLARWYQRVWRDGDFKRVHNGSCTEICRISELPFHWDAGVQSE